MSTLVKFFKVTELPATLEPSSFYYVNDGGDIAESWLTDTLGVAKQIGNTTMVETIVSAIDGGTF